MLPLMLQDMVAPYYTGKFDKKHHFWNICSLSDTLNLNPHE